MHSLFGALPPTSAASLSPLRRRAHTFIIGSIAVATLLISILSVGVPAQGARQFFVAPAPIGSPTNAGTVSSPLDLVTALSSSGPARPGDTIWLLGGTYSGNFTSNLTGSPTAPIIVRQYPGQRATIDSNTANRIDPALTVNGSDTWYWGFEVTDSTLQRNNTAGFNNPVLRQTSVNVFGPRTKFIDMVVHDGQQGFGFWSSAVSAEIYGTLIYNVGVEAPDRGHGHAIYVQNDGGANPPDCVTSNVHCKKITDNILVNGFSFGIHGYTEGGAIDNLDIEGNTIVNAGALSEPKADVLIGGNKVARYPLLKNNAVYYGPNTFGGRGLDLGYRVPCFSPTVLNNYVAVLSGTPINLNCSNVVMTGNTVVGLSTLASTFPNNTYVAGRPTGTVTFVRPNRYEPGRGHVTIYNWDLRPQVSVDLSSLGLQEGAPFEIRDAENYFGPAVVSGSYHAGTRVDIQMSGLTAVDPIGNAPIKASHTGPEFGAFIVLPVVSSAATIPAVTLSATPSLIPPGQSAVLSWATSNATTVSIDQNIGSVPASGTVMVSPAATTTYTLTAAGSGGVSITVSATVTVSLDAPPVLPGTDITVLGAIPIALITAPRGGGNKSFEVIRDGVFPAVGSINSSQQYDTFTGDATRSIDWIGYQFPTPHTFTGLIFQEGRQFVDGGWFTTQPGVQVRVGGLWIDVPNLACTPAYPGGNGVTFERFTFTFNPVTGDAIRLVGTPGGSAPFISVGELRVSADDSFQPVAVTMLAPNGGEVMAVGTQQTIRWTSSQVTTVTLEYRTSASGPWTSIAQNLPASSGSFAWTVPDAVTTQGHVRVSDAANASVTDLSDSDFTIAAKPVAPAAATFGASPNPITAGQSTTLSWSTTNATAVSISPGVGAVAASGTQSVSPSTTTIYTLTVTGPGATLTPTTTVTVTPVTLPASPTATFSASPSPITAGQASTLSWSTANATSVSISPDVGNVAASGTQSVSPSTTTTYTLTATGPGGTLTPAPTTTVTVTPVVVPGVQDLTAAGTLIALITAPHGSGSQSLEVLRDGIFPAVGSANSMQYDTYTGDATRAFDWVGYQFAAPHTFTGLTFQEGQQFPDGGWWTALTVQVLINGTWIDVGSLASTPAYPGANGVPFERFNLSFNPITGDAIRVAGTPGGAARFVSVGELRVLVNDTAQPPSVSALTPNGNEAWLVGSVQTIRWAASQVSSVALEYRTDPTGAWTPIATVAAASGSYAWTVPDFATTQARVRVSDAANGTLTDSSDNDFTIVAAAGRVTNPQDLTAVGTPIALITAPTGGGSRNLEILRDGVFPAAGSTNSAQQYDTYTGDSARTFDWVGYQFAALHTFTGLTFQEGIQFYDGGWFATLTVQVRVGGLWIDVPNLVSTPSYPGANGITFERFMLTFSPLTGDAIRVAGVPGGLARFISLGEFRVTGQ